MHPDFGLVAKFLKNMLVTWVQMGTKDEKKWKFSASALGSNGVPGDFDPRAHGSKKKITQIPGTPPLFDGFDVFLIFIYINDKDLKTLSDRLD